MKKLFLVLTLLTLSASIFANTLSFAPENDLWKEDNLLKSNQIDQELFNKIIDAGLELYKPRAKANRERLKINRKWKTSTVNANATRIFKFVTINMYGGLARRPEMTPEGFALVLCHELNHPYGGAPLVRKWQKLSAEGQADYMGAKDCIRGIIKKLNLRSEEEPTAYMEDVCNDDRTCIRALVGGQSLGNLLAVMRSDSMPDYTTPDPTVVTKTILSYPKTTQCRLDTYFSGVLNKKRPACWFNK